MSELQQSVPGMCELPLRWRPLLDTRDLRRANRVIDELVDPLRFSCESHAPDWDIRVTGVTLEHFKIFGVRHGPSHVVGSRALRSHHFILPVSGTLAARIDAAEVEARPGEAIIYPAGTRIRARWSHGGSAALVLTIDQDVFERTARRHVPLPPRAPWAALKLSLASGPGRSFANLLECLCVECDNLQHGGGSDAILRGLEDLLLRAVLEIRAGTLPPPSRQGSTPRRRSGVARAVDHIHARTPAAVTSEELCRVACLSPRSLQTGFMEHYGMGPMGYARWVRLSGAREALAAAGPGDASIAAVAARWGFPNPSTFARVYRKTFDELPSETLRRRG